MKADYMETNNAEARPDSLGRLLNFATGAMNRMCQARLAEHDLLLAQWVILSALWARDGLHVSELARYSGNNLPAASRIVDRMVDKGLVARSADAEDRRSVRDSWSIRNSALQGRVTYYTTVSGARAAWEVMQHLEVLRPYALQDLHATLE